MKYTQHYKTRLQAKNTTQVNVLPGREEDMSRNNAGGVSFNLDSWKQLDRFLILGSEGNTYYCTEKKMTKDSAETVLSLIKLDGLRVVKTVTEVSNNGRAPKNDPAIFVLAMCASFGDLETKRAAFNNLYKVCRIPTHLFQFVECCKAFRGWGRGLRTAIASYYEDTELSKLMFHITKYQSREGWSHKDLLKLSHPKTSDTWRNNVFSYILHGFDGKIPNDNLEYLVAVEEAKEDIAENRLINLITKYKLPMECIPTDKRTSKVYEAVFSTAGLTWVVRNLGNLSKSGLLSDYSFSILNVLRNKLTDVDTLKKNRIHPIQVLSALNTYSKGSGFRGSNTWDISQKVVDILNESFYKSFGVLEATGKNILIGLDVSGSMCSGEIAGVPGLSPRVASCAMCLINKVVERNVGIMAFCGEFIPVTFSEKDRLDTIINKVARMEFGRTDCSLPMAFAQEKNIRDIDAFVIYTDNETYAGNRHPTEELKRYNNKYNRNAKLIVVGMTSTGFTIADPKSNNMLDVVGFDTATPNLINDFISEKF